ncbi:MAG: aminoglycoside phosphotransferase family protein [Peptostreptococcaceae bacterium]|nr:aminoglycoside phosphotransferase family protein [Peptostreptococcaceae bacterium]
MHTEETLQGGNMTSILKKHGKIHRERHLWSPSTQRLLQHLEAAGFHQAPKHLGTDGVGREILTFMEGECKHLYPFTNDRQINRQIITDLAGLIRKFHDASASFKISGKDIWMLSYQGNLPKEVICHNDIAPYNVAFINDRPVHLIDFDTCCPAPRIWDIVYALYRFVPFSKTVYDPERAIFREYRASNDADWRRESVALFFRAYQMPCPENLFEIMADRLRALADYICSEARKKNPVFEKMVQEKHLDLYLSDIAFMEKHSSSWI